MISMATLVGIKPPVGDVTRRFEVVVTGGQAGLAVRYHPVGGVGRDAAFLSDRIASDSGVEQRRVHKGAAAVAP